MTPFDLTSALQPYADASPETWLPDVFEGHVPVMFREVIASWLQSDSKEGASKVYVDGTLGGGGHSFGAWQCIQSGTQPSQWYGIDQDATVLQNTQSKLATLGHTQLKTCHGNFSQLPRWVQEGRIPKITGGLLLDLGVSSFQLDTPERGFSFRHEAPLDMRMNPHEGIPLHAWLMTQTEADLKHVLWHYGEERYAGMIARWILEDKPQTTGALARLVERAYAKRGNKRGSHHHPATRTFQALRIALNQELLVLEHLLEALPTILAPGATVVVLTFHSLEDRIVKRAFKRYTTDEVSPPHDPIYRVLKPAVATLHHRKARIAQSDELAYNPRARSAKLRAMTWL